MLDNYKAINFTRQSIIFLLLFVLVLFFLDIFLLIPKELEKMILIFWGVLLGINIFARGFIICPKCKENAFLKGAYGNTLSSTCLHCGTSFKVVKSASIDSDSIDSK